MAPWWSLASNKILIHHLSRSLILNRLSAQPETGFKHCRDVFSGDFNGFLLSNGSGGGPSFYFSFPSFLRAQAQHPRDTSFLLLFDFSTNFITIILKLVSKVHCIYFFTHPTVKLFCWGSLFFFAFIKPTYVMLKAPLVTGTFRLLLYLSCYGSNSR